MNRLDDRADALAAQIDARATGAILTRADTIRPEPIMWLWEGWLAAGKLHIMAGSPGTGKTTLALAMGATVTCGGRWPDGTRASMGDVVIWSGEDDPTDTLVPRLMAMGADRRRVHIVSGMTDAQGHRSFDPARDIGALGDAMSRIDARLLIVDPIVSAVSGDSHHNAETRRGLQPLVDLAAARGCALIGITHLSKGTAGRDPVERVTGSLAFGALARVVMLAAQGEDGRVLCRAKSNIGPDTGGYGYGLRQDEVPGYTGLYASSVLWGSAVQGTARELIGEAEEIDGDASPRDEAAEWLRGVLADGPVSSRDIQRMARQDGHAWATVRRAKQTIGAASRKEGFREGAAWAWVLPAAEDAHAVHEDAEDAHSQGVSTFANGEHLRADGAAPEPEEVVL